MSRPFVELYIEDKKVQFKEPPEIFMNYSHYDLHNPTVVKNSFSKTITIDGTPENNRIFNTIYDMKRINMEGLYNPSKKVPFTLYRNGEPMETGYVKLDKVKRKGNNIQYDITLYGGLGEFLYNLQYKDDGEQMKLSDLDYGGGDNELDLTITKDTINDAWYSIMKVNNNVYDDIYNFINFAPCYNGIPNNFTADKVAIDVDSFAADWDGDGDYEGNSVQLRKQFITSKDGYTTVDGWLIGELEKEYDEWQMKDLRSYLQRPVIRFKKIIEACCNPKNNGGYYVDLDEDFFSSGNEYYENAWMTLPLVSELETVEGDGAEYAYLKDDGEKITIVDIADGTTLKSLKIPMAMCATANAGGKSPLYTGVQITLNPTNRVWVESYNACKYVQLVVYDGSNKVVAGSNINSFYTNIKNAVNFNYNPIFNSTINKITGNYIKAPDSNLYVFNAALYDLEIQNIEWKSDYYMKIVIKDAEIRNYETPWYRPDYPENEKMENNLGVNYLYKRNEYHGWEDTVKSVSFSSTIDSNMFEITSMPDNTKDITKKKLLNSEHTPCDYFLSYLKMFNLHIWKDMYDNIIHIRKRPNYFIDDKYDLEQLIDRDGDMNITPLTFDSKWMTFENESNDDGKLYKDYLDEFGIPYGIQKVDTNYNFDNSSTNLFDKSVFKSCITARQKSRYYVDIYQTFSDDDVFYPPYCLDGFQTFLFNASGDTTEGSYFSPKTTQKFISWWNRKYYDIFPKPSFVDGKNEPIDGENVLLFYNGRQLMKNVEGNEIRFQITDDIPQFETLNEGEPCWIWSMDKDVSIIQEYMPIFSRYKTNENGWITHSWDFGTPKYLYIPDYSIDDSSNIYTQYWQPYIRDMYSVNTRIVECKVLLKERVIGDWLRRFYYFDGSYWLLNKVIDYDVTSNGTTKCEFVRVNDIQNYLQ